MPKAYVIMTEDIHDKDGMNAYGAAAAPTMGQYGAKVLTYSAPETLEGEWHGGRTVVLEFESVEAAKAWYESSEYQAAKPLRLAAATSNAAIVPGI